MAYTNDRTFCWNWFILESGERIRTRNIHHGLRENRRTGFGRRYLRSPRFGFPISTRRSVGFSSMRRIQRRFDRSELDWWTERIYTQERNGETQYQTGTRGDTDGRWIEADILVHWEPQRITSENAVHGRVSETFGWGSENGVVLHLRRHESEADGHLDKPCFMGTQSGVSERQSRLPPPTCAPWSEDWNAGNRRV